MNNIESEIMEELYSLIPLSKEKADLFINNCLNKDINMECDSMPDDITQLTEIIKEKGFKKTLEGTFYWSETNEKYEFWHKIYYSLPLEIGEKVKKPKGYAFDGIIVSIFQTTKGETRIVAELENNGMLHIFNENQLELR